MSDKVVPITKADQRVIEALSTLLDLAKQGQIKSLAVVLLCPDDVAQTMRCWSESPEDAFKFIGALECLKAHFVEAANGGA